MKIVCWNVLGAKKSQLHLEVGFINRTIRLDILILLATMVNDHNAEIIAINLGFSNFDTIPLENRPGGLWCLCNTNNVEVTMVSKESSAIQCHILDKCNGKQCVLSVVYAPA